MGNVFIQAPSENEVLAKIEHVGDVAVKNALLALFYWRLGTQQAVEPPTTQLNIKVSED
jgi:hypothetical protein